MGCGVGDPPNKKKKLKKNLFMTKNFFYSVQQSLGCGVALRVRCGSDCSASACCTAGPSSNLGSAPLEEVLYRADAMRMTRGALYE